MGLVLSIPGDFWDLGFVGVVGDEVREEAIAVSSLSRDD